MEPLYVIVLNWNGEGVLADCLESLGAVREPELRVIVVDNASSDSSPDMVAERFPEVTLIRNETNLLFAEGNNVGLRYAMEQGGRWFLLLNNDTEVEPGFAAAMMKAVRDGDDTGIVGPKILYHDRPDRIWYAGGGFHPVIWVPKHEHIRKRDGSFPDEAGETAYVSGCALLVRREVVEKIGYLDPAYKIYCEDVDFCLRARRAGWRCRYEPAARLYHKISSSSGGGLTPFKLENRLVSTNRLYARFRSKMWRAAVAPLHFMGFAVVVAGLALTGRWKLVGAAFRGAARILGGE